MKKILFICALLFAFSISTMAQRETYNWIFGNKAGLTWNTTRSFTGSYVYGGTGTVNLNDMPTNISSPLAATEGCFTLSDRKGKLLLFSNGAKLYNANKTVMNSTDMIGNIGNAQSGILFPYPGNPNKYVAVTTGYWSFDELGYTVIDMKGNSGLGSVESINNPFPAGRKGKVGGSITSIRHTNGTDYWVVAPGKGDPSYLNIWRFKPDGVEAPKSYQLPTTVKEGVANGYIKFSPNGKHFVWGTFSDSKLLFGNFDAETGIFSNIKYITGTVGGNEFYGVEFSMSGKYMYVSQTSSGIVSNFYLYCFDFDALINSANPQNYYQNQMKRIAFPASTGGMPSAIQLGPDGRMYISGFPYFTSPASFYVIENPEQFNNLKIFRLDNFLTGTAQHGLPSFAASWFELKISGETEFCQDNIEREYTLTISNGVGSEDLAYMQWNFGDGTTLVKDNTIADGSIQSHKHAYSTAGNYTITVTSHKANGEEITAMGRQTLAVKVLAAPSFTVSASDVCIGSSGTMTVNNLANDVTVNWYNNTTATTPIQTGKTCSTGVQNTAGTITFYVEAINATGCSSGRIPVNVKVKACGNDFIPVNPHLRGYFTN
ncbi:MAG: PKD domain-containing protein [Dysgonomonas sp.]|nr:PKD domain-containing protein [Dysgonomonas sp.]